MTLCLFLWPGKFRCFQYSFLNPIDNSPVFDYRERIPIIPWFTVATFESNSSLVHNLPTPLIKDHYSLAILGKKYRGVGPSVSVISVNTILKCRNCRAGWNITPFHRLTTCPLRCLRASSCRFDICDTLTISDCLTKKGLRLWCDITHIPPQ